MFSIPRLIYRLKREGRFEEAKEAARESIGKLTRRGYSREQAEQKVWRKIARDYQPIRTDLWPLALKDSPPCSFVANRKRMEVAWVMLAGIRAACVRHDPRFARSLDLIRSLGATDLRMRLEIRRCPSASPLELRDGLAYSLLVDPLAALDELETVFRDVAEVCQRRQGKLAEKIEVEAAMVLNELPVLRRIALKAAATYGQAVLDERDGIEAIKATL